VRGWTHFKKELGEFVEILPASQRYSEDWYQGTADAIYQNLDIIRAEMPDYVMVLSGDHVYKMDYGPMLIHHVESGADMTVCCLEVPVEEAANAFGVMQVDRNSKVTAFQEKPAQPAEIPDRPGLALASMGNYIFNTDFLFDRLLKDAANLKSSHDFGNDIIPGLLDHFHVQAYPFRDPETGGMAYWRDVGTLDSFWLANMELVGTVPSLSLYEKDWPLWTYQEQLPPAKFVFNRDDRRGMAVDSMVSGGCVISGSQVSDSVIFSHVRINSYSSIEKSVILPEVEVGRNVRMRNAIIDRGCVIPKGMVIGHDAAQDRANGLRVTDSGVVLVTRGMLGQPEGFA
jgi:glucose-1-phosphate adenylyltransferase